MKFPIILKSAGGILVLAQMDNFSVSVWVIFMSVGRIVTKKREVLVCLRLY